MTSLLIVGVLMGAPPTYDHPITDREDWPEGITLTTLAHMACTEAGENWTEVRAVLSVALNRARNWKQDIYKVITRPRQFSLRGCLDDKNRWRSVKQKHFEFAEKALNGTLRRPKWMSAKVMWFATETALKKPRKKNGKTYTFYERWWARGWRPVKKTPVGHIYWKSTK